MSTQANLFPQVSGVHGQSQSAPYSNSSGEGSHAGIQSPTPALPDICRGRHQGNQFSEAANERVHLTKNSVREEIYRLIAASAGSGLTSKELGELLHKPLNEFSGRLTELLAARRIEKSGGERNGAAVLVRK